MNDRVVDRAAAHATPAELALRDWLLAGLSFATGVYEAIVFLTFGKVFTAAQTGNLVLLGIGVAGIERADAGVHETLPQKRRSRKNSRQWRAKAAAAGLSRCPARWARTRRLGAVAPASGRVMSTRPS